MAAFDPAPLITAGGTVAAGWSLERIRGLISKFRNKELAFIENKATIDLVLAQRKSPEWRLYDQYIKDQRLRILCQMGLTLRVLENKRDELEDLRSKIHHKHGVDGLRTAQTVQAGILMRLVSILIPGQWSAPDITRRVEAILNDVDRHVVFVKADDSAQALSEDVRIKMSANLPQVFVLCGGGGALRVTDTVAKALARSAFNYDVSEFIEGGRKLVFFSRRTPSPVTRESAPPKPKPTRRVRPKSRKRRRR